MNLSMIRRFSFLAAFAILVSGATVSAPAQDDVIKPKKKAPVSDQDDDVIVPKSKAKTKTPTVGGRSLAGLLKQANLQFETVQNQDGSTMYKIPVSLDGQKTTVLATEIQLGQAPNGEPIKAVLVGSPVAAFPSDYQPSMPLYKAVTGFNLDSLFGKGIITPTGVAYTNAFWLSTADVQTLNYYLFLVHAGRLELKKRVQAVFVEE